MKKLFECCYQTELFFHWQLLEFCSYGIFDGVFIPRCLWSRPYKVLFRMKEKWLCKMLWSACICYFALFYNLQYESWHLCKLEVPASALQEVSGFHSVTHVLSGTVHSLFSTVRHFPCPFLGLGYERAGKQGTSYRPSELWGHRTPPVAQTARHGHCRRVFPSS